MIKRQTAENFWSPRSNWCAYNPNQVRKRLGCIMIIECCQITPSRILIEKFDQSGKKLNEVTETETEQTMMAGSQANFYVLAKRPEKVTGKPFQEEECFTENLKKIEPHGKWKDKISSWAIVPRPQKNLQDH
jgi:hypothetical protein